MSHLDPIAYTYNADVHCEVCAEARFGRNDRGFIAEDAVDYEGNPVGAIFEWDVPEWIADGHPLSCGDCLDIIADAE